MARGWMAASILALACGPQIATDDAGSTSAASAGDEAPASTSDAPGGRPGSGGTGERPCDPETCPPCGDDCEADHACRPDGRVVCSCVCGPSTGPPQSTSGGSDGGEVTDGGAASSEGGEVSSDGGEDTSSCRAGTEGCTCTAEGSCNPGFQCDPNQNVCVLDVCPVGTEGCPCTPAGACDPALQCMDEICLDPDGG